MELVMAIDFYDLVTHAKSMGYKEKEIWSKLEELDNPYGPAFVEQLTDDPDEEGYKSCVEEYGEDVCKIVADFYRKHNIKHQLLILQKDS